MNTAEYDIKIVNNLLGTVIFDVIGRYGFVHRYCHVCPESAWARNT